LGGAAGEEAAAPSLYERLGRDEGLT